MRSYHCKFNLLSYSRIKTRSRYVHRCTWDTLVLPTKRRIKSTHEISLLRRPISHSTYLPSMGHDAMMPIRTVQARGTRGMIRFEAPPRSRTRRSSVRWRSLSCCRVSYDKPSNAAVPAMNAGCCRSAAAEAVSAESDSRAPAPPDADPPGAFADRPFSGTPCRTGRTETACSRCAYACAWSGCCSGRTPCHTPRTCAVSHL